MRLRRDYDADSIFAIALVVVLLIWLLVSAVSAQEPEPTVNYSEHPMTYTTEDVLKFSMNLEAAAPPGMEDFYDKGYYGDPLIYCVNGHDFDIWIVTKDGAVTVPAKGNFVLTRKGE